MKKKLLEFKHFTNQYDAHLYLGIDKYEDDDFVFLISKDDAEKSWDICIEFTEEEIEELKDKGLFNEEDFEIIESNYTYY